MTALQQTLLIGLIAFAVVQLAIATTNLFLVRILGWREDMRRMPPLLKEVFQVHKIFISVTVVTFGVLTLRFARDMVEQTNDLAVWLAAAIGMFWLIRCVMQATYYSPNHWRGQLDRTIVHIAMLVTFGLGAAVYLVAAFAV